MFGALAPVVAQEACTPAANALGVSRTIEIDTSKGPRFGFQYKDQEFLAEGEVILTFDDGPLRAYTKPILETLAAHCTKATFFVVGRMAVADPEMVREYARRGHTVGTHTWSHANLQGLSPLRARAEIELGFSAVQQALGKPLAPFFRFPYLRDTKSTMTHLQERQIAAFSIDVDSKDYRTRDPGSVHRLVMHQLAVQRKGIILFHDIQPSTARALPGLLAELKAKGYRVVHIRPKAQATTMEEFDTIAQQELTKKQVASSGQPLAKRSLTWPTSATSLPTQPVAAPPPAPRPPARGEDDDDWRSRVWRK
jgi:peptidoglycan/xylan/chitin deacetylase (PgdA/CDA1 family)